MIQSKVRWAHYNAFIVQQQKLIFENILKNVKQAVCWFHAATATDSTDSSVLVVFLYIKGYS